MLQMFFIFILFTLSASALNGFEKDTIKTDSGDLVITFIGHGTLMFNYNNLIIHADPYSKLADYTQLPDADIILITHHHGDHLDTSAILNIIKKNTKIRLTETAMSMIKVSPVYKDNYRIMNNGDNEETDGIEIEAVPAYNVIHKRDSGDPYHPKGQCNGYIVSFGDKRVYIAGDTENIPEMKKFSDIDIAFLPMNLPYTMTPQMASQAAKDINPKIFYPYHFGEASLPELLELMKDTPGIEVRIRKMK